MIYRNPTVFSHPWDWNQALHLRSVCDNHPTTGDESYVMQIEKKPMQTQKGVKLQVFLSQWAT